MYTISENVVDMCCVWCVAVAGHVLAGCEVHVVHVVHVKVKVVVGEVEE